MKVKKHIITLVIISSIHFSCNNSLRNIYVSDCLLYGKPEVVLELNKDSTFCYTFRYAKDEVCGKWKKIKDTLILESDTFNINHEGLHLIVKMSNMKSFDKYLIKNKRLYIINNEGKTKDCYLKSGSFVNIQN